MTETVTPETKPEETEEVKAVPAKDSLPEIARVFLERAEKQYAAIVKVADQQKAGDNVGQLLADAIAKSENPEVVKARAAIERANKVILDASKAAEALVKPTLNVPTEAELKALDEEYKSISSALSSYNTVFQKELEGEESLKGLSLFDYLGEIPGGKKKGAKVGQGEGTSRPRVKSLEITSDLKGEQGWEKVEKDGNSTFTLLAQKIKDLTGETVGAGDLHEEWVKQGNASKWTDLPDSSSFVFSVTDAKQKVHQFHVRVGK